MQMSGSWPAFLGGWLLTLAVLAAVVVACMAVAVRFFRWE